MRCPAFRFLFSGLLAGLLMAAAPQTARRLEPGDEVEARLGEGESHLYEIAAAADRYRAVLVEQKGVDTMLDLAGPAGEPLGTFDAPTGKRGIDSVVVPAGSGVYRLTVRPSPGSGVAFPYGIRVEEVSEITGEDRERLAAERCAAETARLYNLGSAEARKEALAQSQQALVHWQALGEKARAGWTLQALGILQLTLGDLRQASAVFTDAAALWEAQGDGLGQADALSGVGMASLQMGDLEAARAAFERTLPLQSAAGDRYGEARTRSNLCLIRHTKGELREAAACYEQVLALYEELGAGPQIANTHRNLAGVWEILGEPGKARESYEQALSGVRSFGDRRDEGQVLNNLAVFELSTGEVGQALAHLEESLAIFREVGDRLWEARSLHNLGEVLAGLGEPERALANLEPAAALRREIGDRRGESNTLNLLGRLYGEAGEEARAGEAHARALELARAAGVRREEAASLLWVGRQKARTGQGAEGVQTLQQAVALAREVGDRSLLAAALQSLAEAGPPAAASSGLAFLEEALALQRASGDRRGEADALTALARTERRNGQIAAALAHAEEAVHRIEELRLEVDLPDLRASYLGRRQRSYELAIDLQMELHRQEPAAGHDRAAFELAERARARSLLDLLEEAQTGLLRGLDPAVRERRQALLLRLAAVASQRGSSRGEASPELQDLLAGLDRLDTEIRQANPRYASLAHPRLLRTEEVQAMLEPDTLVLEYSLGEERSWLWAVDRGSFTTVELPARAEVEALARSVYEELRRPDQGDPRWQEARAERLRLSRMLLGPVAARLAGRRLAVVAGGALQYIPFAALPEPETSGATPEPLVVQHEILTLPSVSALALQRTVAAGRPSPPKKLAVVADPVFSPEDARLKGKAVAPGTLPAGETVLSRDSSTALPRLGFTRREAEEIAALVPAGQSLVALDFQASREMVLGSRLADYRVIHFATHGLIDARTPALSGLALSQVDAAGRPQQGFLGLPDVYGLDLTADLVVLSGCETALGREIRGEGLVGLARGFMYAGATRVMASLWNVRDRSTAELMGHFYRSLLAEGRPPAAALRQAQLLMLREPRWRDPYFWAAFVLQGDWRP